MHTTSQLYKDILAGIHSVRTILELETIRNNATEYVELDESSLFSLKTSGSLFPSKMPSIGNFCAREIDVVLVPPAGVTIPRMARIRLFVYLTDGERTSERIPKGVFYVDTRRYAAVRSKVVIHGYDATLKFDEDFNSSDYSWPQQAVTVVNAIANSAGVNVSSETVSLLQSLVYRNIPLMPNMTKREVLSGIACQFGGNFHMNDLGELELVSLNTLGDTVVINYLSDESGNNILIGGDRIIV